MSTLLMLLVFNELVILGIIQTTNQEMIFERPAIWMQDNVTEWICKPLFSCANCMASLWGTIVYWIYFVDFTPQNLTIWPFYLLALCGLSKLTLDNAVKF